MNDLIDRKTAINALLNAYPLMQKEKLVAVMETVQGTEAGDCISRKMAIESYCKRYCSRRPQECGIYPCYLVNVVKEVPSAQPERKKGRWLVDEDGNMECPFCGNTCGFGNYCNECGADMRGERDDSD